MDKLEKFALAFPSIVFQTIFLVYYFYCSLDLVIKGVADQLVQGGLVRHLHDVVALFLDYITKVNRTLHNREDQVPNLKKV